MPDFIGGLAKGIEKSRGMIENAMNGVTSDLTITPRVMAAQGGYSGSAASSGDLISGINTALNTALAGGGAAGDIVIPVYIGGDMIDEIVVTAQQRMNLHLQYLVFNNENIPMPASYSVSLSDVEADSGGVTEAGTTQRDVVREGVVQISVTFRVSKRWLNKFSAYKKLASITVGYLDMETMNIVDTQMYIDGYQVKLVSDTSYGSLWEVSFTLKEF